MRTKILALLLCVGLLWLLQGLLMPKYTGADRDGSLSAEYYAYAGDHDVLFLGDCEVYENISPVTLWEEYGITACVRGTPQQTIWQSYYLLEDTLKYETPQIVVFNVQSMQYDSPQSTGNLEHREAYNRMTLDGMRWSVQKYRAIQASMTPKELEQTGMWSYVFPLLRFHDRWNSLTAEDFRYLFGKEPISYQGYLMQTGVKPVTGDYIEPPPVRSRFGENSYAYLDKIVALCRERGITLIFMKAPSLSPIWWEAWETQIEAYAQEQEIPYFNFLEHQEDIGLDWSADTYDAGLHLNVFGAEKLSRYFGAILQSEFHAPNRTDQPQTVAKWTAVCEKYAREKAAGAAKLP